MALVLNDRVRETTSVVGTGAVNLLGYVGGYQAFSVIGNANTCYYGISDQVGLNWEVGIGTYSSSGNTLARTTVLKSSNSNNLVSFTAGTKDVFVTYPAETAISGGGGGTYPTVQPTLNLDFANSKTVDPRITFVRNSTAAYYDGQTSALAEQNLLLQSNFQSAWGPNGGTLSANSAVAPDGTTTAATITSTSLDCYVIQSTSMISGVTYTFSVWLSAASATTIRFGIGGTYIAAVSVTTSWQRFTLTVPYDGAFNRVAIGGVSSFPSTSPAIYAWGAQLEQRSSATAYTPTTTAAITNYIPVLMTAPAGVPRLDYNPTTGQALGLLIEESRTNLAVYSSDFTAWTAISSPIIDKTANIAPDGTQTNNLFTAGAANARCQRNTVTVTASIPYTISVYAKAGNASYLTLGSAGSPATSAIFNLTTGAVSNTVGSPSTSITSVGNGEYRCTITLTPTTTSLTVIIGVGSTNTFASSNFPANSIGDSGYIWGAQLEAGAFATSYIPTVASTVTRASDNASMTGTNFSSWYNQSEWTFYWESNSTLSTVNAITWELYTLIPYLITASGWNNTNGGLARFITYGSTTVSQVAGSIVAGTTNKYSATTKPGTGNNILALNGVVQATTASPAWVIVPTGLYLYDVNSAGTTNTLNGHIRKLSYYPVALSSSNLVALTS
jgi:hypothetical protein